MGRRTIHRGCKKFMNRIIRNLFSLGLLWLSTSALISTLKTSIRYVEEAPFLQIMIPAMVLAYLLGVGSWTTRRAWTLLLLLAPMHILLQASDTAPAIWQIFVHLPSLIWDTLLSWTTGQFLDISFFQIQLDKIAHHAEIFRQGLHWDSDGRSVTLIELSWDIPLYLVGAWSGWWSSRRNSILIALVPSVGMQVFLLLYADRPEKIALQIGVFTLIFLMSFHQKWSIAKSESRVQGRVRMETYAVVFILCSVLVLASGATPIVPTPEEPVKVRVPKDVNETAENYSGVSNIGASSGLPRDYMINTPPKNLMNVVFLANTGQTPSSDQDDKRVESAVQRYYWRWITYDQYNGKVWSSSPTTHASYSADQTLFEYSGEGYRLVHQTIMKASVTDNHLYWTGSLLEANQPVDTTWRVPPPGADPLLSMDMLGSLVQAQQYSADSLLPQFSAAQLREASQVYPTEVLQKYLSLPEDKISQRVRDLAATLTFQAQNPYDKAKAIETYLRTYPYTLDVPVVPSDREISDYFLFELKTGYCEYYATSMVVLARASGLPSRIVLGYASSEYDAHSAQYIVRELHSHSWVEIYFPEIGWVEFEPTANQPLMEELLPLQDLNVPIPLETAQKSRLGVVHQKHGYFVKDVPIFGMLLFMFAAMGMCVLVLRMQGLWFSYKTIGSIFEYVYLHGRKITPHTPPNATPSLFIEELKTKLRFDHPFMVPAADELDQLTSLYLKETYSPHPVTGMEQQQAIKVWYRLFWRLLYARMVLTFGPFAAYFAATKQSPPK
jgi:hypothetical protein